jgi:exopolysaccharide biosynthesis protein
MKNGLAFAILGMMALITSDASAGDEEIWGTYRLISSTKKYLDTGNTVNSFGAHPKGYITYGKEGRMLVLITYDGRIKPEDALKTTIEERDALYRSMIAYGGTYTYSGNRIEHHVDISRNESQVGTTLIRNVTRDGNRLTYVTEPFEDGSLETLGKIVVNTLIWEKVQ